MKKSNLILGLAVCVFTVSSMAASDGIRKNRTNECAAWLCVPGGFPSGCEAAHSAFIGRITDYTSGKHPKRKYTDLPNINNCLEKAENEDKIGSPQTTLTYVTTIVAVVPEHKECTHLQNIEVREYDSENGGYTYVIKKKCDAWKTVPLQKFEGNKCVKDTYRYDDFGQIIGSNSEPAFCTQTINRTKVFGNGQMYGNAYDYTY